MNFQNSKHHITAAIAFVGVSLMIWIALNKLGLLFIPADITDPDVLRLCEEYRRLPYGPKKTKIAWRIARSERRFRHSTWFRFHRYSDYKKLLDPAPDSLEFETPNIVHFVTDTNDLLEIEINHGYVVNMGQLPWPREFLNSEAAQNSL